MEHPQLEAGTLIAGRYQLECEIGHGGMGTVWRALHLTLQGPVAIKLVNATLLGSDEARARFLREARSAAALRSTHVVQILDHGLHGEVPYIVMELLEGESLAKRLARQGVLSLAQTLEVIEPVCRALSLAHQRGIVHRDLKPDNIFIALEGELEVVKVLDFGIAKDTNVELRASLQTQEGAILGTPYYLSPEQAQGSLAVDHRADLWSLAVIACECITGRKPFESKHMGDLIVRICSRPLPVPSTFREVPEGFDQWFARALSREPSERFQSSSSLLNALTHVSSGLDSAVSMSPSWEKGAAAVDSGASELRLTPSRELASSTTEPERKDRLGAFTLLLAAAVLTLGLGLWLLRREVTPTAASLRVEAAASAASALPVELSETSVPTQKTALEPESRASDHLLDKRPEVAEVPAAADSQATALARPTRAKPSKRPVPAAGSSADNSSNPAPEPALASAPTPAAPTLDAPINEPIDPPADTGKPRVDFGF